MSIRANEIGTTVYISVDPHLLCQLLIDDSADKLSRARAIASKSQAFVGASTRREKVESEA